MVLFPFFWIFGSDFVFFGIFGWILFFFIFGWILIFYFFFGDDFQVPCSNIQFYTLSDPNLLEMLWTKYRAREILQEL